MKRNLLMVGASVTILLVGVGGLVGLRMLRQQPAQADTRERSLYVEAIRVAPEREPVVIDGYGTARSRRTASIAAEVAGAIIEVHPRLDAGEVIAAGETLFVVDPRTYEAQLEDARANVGQAKSRINRLELQYNTDRERLATLERTRDLALTEYERLRDLFEKDQVGTLSGVEQAEQNYNGARDRVDLLKSQLDVYPVEISEAKSSLAAAEAKVAQVSLSLERTRVKAPFDGRVRSHSVALGQYVSPGNPVVTLADDSLLEVSVPLNSRDARDWLRFAEERPDAESAWFAALAPVECRVRWTEDESHYWTGTLHRVEEMSEETRTLTVVVRVEGERAYSADPDQLPLVDGMFCEVSIPGKEMRDVFRLPRSAVTFEGTVYVSDNNRLRTVPVVLAREQDGFAFIREGLEAGDIVLVTRLVSPLENSLLGVTMVEIEPKESAPGQSEVPYREANG